MIFENSADLQEKGGIATIEETRPDDLFFASASFEDRTLAATRSLSPGYRAKHAFVYVNREFLSGPSGPRTCQARDGLLEVLHGRSESAQVIEGSWLDAVDQVQSIRSALAAFEDRKSVRSVTIDVTTFNREALIVCIGMLRVHFASARIRALYVAPESHGDWLSRGFRKVRSIVGFSGIQQATKGTALVALSGFEGDRTIKIIEEHEPTRVYLGFGDPPTVPSFLDRNLSENRLVLDRTDVDKFSFPASSISACTSTLRSLVGTLLRDYNVIIAPMSTKLSTLAALCVAQEHPEVQLTYCLPGEYNTTEYSSGASRIFIEDVF
jgi:hypothetical protein